MIAWIVAVGVLFFLGAVFYKQSVQEFRLNQIEWEQRHQLEGLFDERVPVVVRSMPPSPVWTQEDVLTRDFYGNEPEPTSGNLKKSLRDVLVDPEAKTAWPPEFRRHLFGATALSIWFDKFWVPVIAGSRGWLADLLPPVGECWHGSKGLDKVRANWQLIVPTEGAIIVSLMTDKSSKYLPAKWKGLLPSKINRRTVPFADELKFMDVIVRTGTALWVPAHWYVAWEGKEAVPPLVCTVDIHNPISWLVSRRTKA
jgi:hypothetical protein